MATVEAFVDDAVRGRLPHICAKTGLPADGKLRIEQTRGGWGLAGLLIFLGPIGWIVLIVIAFAADREMLTVRLPYSEAAVDRERRLQRMRLISGVVSACAVVAALVVHRDSRDGTVALFVLVAFVSAVFAMAQHFRLGWTRVGVRLDASRRWVTLSRVHPDFARAVNASNASTSL